MCCSRGSALVVEWTWCWDDLGGVAGPGNGAGLAYDHPRRRGGRRLQPHGWLSRFTAQAGRTRVAIAWVERPGGRRRRTLIGFADAPARWRRDLSPVIEHRQYDQHRKWITALPPKCPGRPMRE